MRPVAGAVMPMAPLGAEVAAAPADSEAELEPLMDRDREAEVEADIRDMVVGVIPPAEEAVGEAEAEPGAGAAPDPPPEAETAPSSDWSPVAAAPPPVAVRVGAW